MSLRFYDFTGQLHRSQSGALFAKERRESILKRRLQAELLVDRLKQTTEAADVLTRREWIALFEVLFSRHPVRSDYRRLPDESICIVLAAFRQYGAAADLSTLANLWGDTIAMLWASEPGQIAEAAEACLPVIQARLQREKDKKTLLRPGERGEESGELLRAATGTPRDDGARMLRPSIEESPANAYLPDTNALDT